MTGRVNGNLKAILAVAIPLIGVAVGFGILQSDVSHNTDSIFRVETQAQQGDARIESRLTRIEDKLDRLLERD